MSDALGWEFLDARRGYVRVLTVTPKMTLWGQLVHTLWIWLVVLGFGSVVFLALALGYLALHYTFGVEIP